MPLPELVIGVDAGGTVSRGVLTAPDGRRLATTTGPGINPRSSTSTPVEALTDLLGPLAAAGVGLGVLGVAGAGAAGLAAVERAAAGAWAAAGLPGAPRVVPDIAVAHAAGSPSTHGTVLIAGTGAVAAVIRDGEVLRRADGHGWLLGDTGSAVWLGLRAVRAALAALDGRAEATRLAVDVLAALDVLDGEDQLPATPQRRTALAQRAIGAVDRMRPAELGRLAPLVSRAAEAGDRVAIGLAEAAVSGLVQTLAAVSEDIDGTDSTDEPRGTGPAVVLAGSVVRRPGPVRSGVRAAVRGRWGTDPLDAGDGAGGAAVLALRAAGHPVTADVHARLTAP